MNILMYHAIGAGRGPLSIDVGVFRMQLDMLARAGFRGAALRDAVAPAGAPISASQDRVAVLTFDDGYRDFAEVAWPEIEARGWGATVFLPTGLIGAPDGWDPDGGGRRQLLDWAEARQLAERGAELGAHTVTHRDLTRLASAEAREEIETCRTVIESRTGARVTSFAAPFGRTTPAIRADIARVYQRAVGSTLAPATDRSDRFNLPRIEMWYFRNPARWRQYLEGASGYLAVRRTLRRARQLVRQTAGWS